MGLSSLIEKASRMNLTTGLFGRNLSEEEMERSKSCVVIKVRENSNVRTRKTYFVVGEEFVVEKLQYSKTYARDSTDHGETNPKYVKERTITSIYNKDGKLRERSIKDSASLGKDITVKFNPPGRIIGSSSANNMSRFKKPETH